MGRNYGYPTGAPQATPSRPGDLDLLFEGAVFFKNLELTGYHDDSVDGETFVGFLSPIRLRYQRSKNVTAEVGAILGHNFGDDQGLDVAEPLFRVVVEPLPDNYFVAGTIIRTHWIHDALYDDVFAFRDNAEQGFQYRVDGEWLKQDLWLDWRIRETEHRSEQFNGANATQLRFGQLWLDGQFYWSHVGGQKNLEDRVANNSQFLTGASYGLSLPWLLGGQLRAGGHYLWGSQTEDVGISSSNGQGTEVSLLLDTFPTDRSILRLFAKHYVGKGRYAARGDPLYDKDRYSQFGFSMVLAEFHGLRTEIGVVAQLVDGTFMNTYQLHVLWGDVLPIGNCRDRHFWNTRDLVSPLVETTSVEGGTLRESQSDITLVSAEEPIPAHPQSHGGSPDVVQPFPPVMSFDGFPSQEPNRLPYLTQRSGSSNAVNGAWATVERADHGRHLPERSPASNNTLYDLEDSPFAAAVTTQGAASPSRQPAADSQCVVATAFETPLDLSQDSVEAPSQAQQSGWQLLPPNLLWSPPWANPHEPRCYGKVHEIVETAIGAAFPVVRYSPTSSPDEGLQIDLTFAVFTAFVRDNVRFGYNEVLLAANDYHMSVPLTFKAGNWEYKLAYEFSSSHLGDEYAIVGYEYAQTDRKIYPLRARRDDIVLGIGRRFANALRIYGQLGASCTKADTLAGKSPVRYDWGFEWTPKPTNRWTGGPFAALDMDLRGEHDFRPGTTLQVGWAWTTQRHRRSSLRFAAEYYDGNSPYEQWFDQRTAWWGFGTYYDW